MSSSDEIVRPVSDETANDDVPGGAVFWIGAGLGIGIMAFGLRGLFMNSRATQPFEFAKWFVGGDILHDLLIAPVVALVGFGVGRILPRPWRAPVQAGLFATAIMLAVGWAPMRGYGRVTAPGNETVQPLDYSTAMLTVIAITWLIVAVWLGVIAVRRWSARTRPRSRALEPLDPSH